MEEPCFFCDYANHLGKNTQRLTFWDIMTMYEWMKDKNYPGKEKDLKSIKFKKLPMFKVITNERR